MAPRVVEKRRDFEAKWPYHEWQDQPAGGNRVARCDRSLVDALGGAAAILDQLGTAGGILQPRMFEA